MARIGPSLFHEAAHCLPRANRVARLDLQENLVVRIPAGIVAVREFNLLLENHRQLIEHHLEVAVVGGAHHRPVEAQVGRDGFVQVETLLSHLA